MCATKTNDEQDKDMVIVSEICATKLKLKNKELSILATTTNTESMNKC